MRSKRWRLWLLVSLLGLVMAKVWLLDTAVSAEGEFAIDMSALHSAAIASGAALPAAIEVERIGDFSFPRSLVVAGDGLFRMHPMALVSHRVVWPDRSIVIDTALSPEEGKSLPGSTLHAAGYARMQRALTQAEHIIFTHEHIDHVGGIASAPDFPAIAGRVLLTREQFNGPKLEREKFAPGALAQLKPLDYRGLHMVAPGVVLQKAPGHTVGTQLVYVELANGVRYLFVGDIAWSEDNIERHRGRPRLATMMMGEDRGAVAAQVRALGALPKEVHQVIAHDPVALSRDIKAGLVHEGFRL